MPLYRCLKYECRHAIERDAKATLSQHYLAVNFSIKNVLQAAEMLKAKKYEVCMGALLSGIIRVHFTTRGNFEHR